MLALAKPAVMKLALLTIFVFFLQVVDNNGEVVAIILLLSNMLLEELCPFQMNWQDELHFIVKIGIVDTSLDQLLPQKNGHDCWNEGHTNRHSRLNPGRLRQNPG